MPIRGATSGAGDGQPRSKGVVYVVDDNEAVRNSAIFLLRAEGYSCRAFPTGLDFLMLLLELEPGCVLLDFAMPGLTGPDVLKELRWMEIEWPVVMMTGHDRRNVAPAATRHGAFRVLEKPFEPELLIDILNRAFASGKLAPRRSWDFAD